MAIHDHTAGTSEGFAVMRGAEILWDQDMADRASELLEMGTGVPRPQGLYCPLIGDGLVVPHRSLVVSLDAVA